MKPPQGKFKVSIVARDRLMTLKRRTGLEHWNELCRWAFVSSLAIPSPPETLPDSPDSNVELDWHLFAGELSDVFIALLAMRAVPDGVELQEEGALRYLRMHLERGIAVMLNSSDIVSLCESAATRTARAGLLSSEPAMVPDLSVAEPGPNREREVAYAPRVVRAVRARAPRSPTQRGE